MTEDCIFCKIATGEIPSNKVYEDDDIVAFHDIEAQAPVHVLFIPRQHIGSLLETDTDRCRLLGELQLRAVQVARELGLDKTGFRTVVNTGFDGGQNVFHLHLHLLGGRKMIWPPG